MLVLLRTHWKASEEMVYSLYKRQRILYYRYEKGFKARTIDKLLRDEGMLASERGITKFIQTFSITGKT